VPFENLYLNFIQIVYEKQLTAHGSQQHRFAFVADFLRQVQQSILAIDGRRCFALSGLYPKATFLFMIRVERTPYRREELEILPLDLEKSHTSRLLPTSTSTVT
jgi:hypothetical protein